MKKLLITLSFVVMFLSSCNIVPQWAKRPPTDEEWRDHEEIMSRLKNQTDLPRTQTLGPTPEGKRAGIPDVTIEYSDKQAIFKKVFLWQDAHRGILIYCVDDVVLSHNNKRYRIKKGRTIPLVFLYDGQVYTLTGDVYEGGIIKVFME